MVLWKCNGCGYIHDDDEAPEQCPKCGAPKESFVKLEESAASLIVRSRRTNEAHMNLLVLCEKAYDQANTILEDELDPNCVALAERTMQDLDEIIQSVKAELQAHVMKQKWG